MKGDMDGIDLRMRRLFRNGSLLLAALDHGQYVGVPEGLPDVAQFIKSVDAAPFDGYILNPGVVRSLERYNPSKSLILRVTHAGTRLSDTGRLNRYFLHPEDALRIGADAVVSMVVLGHGEDTAAIHELGKAICEYHRYGIPVIAEMLPEDPQQFTSTKTIANLSRIGAEIGADIIKTHFTDEFSSVVAGCPVPIIIAGGHKDDDFLSNLEVALRDGARGLALGRNLYQAESPLLLAARVAALVGRTSR